MAVVEVVSESEVVVRNSALKWTLAWLFFVVVLLIPAIFCLVQSTKKTEQGGEIVPVRRAPSLMLLLLRECVAAQNPALAARAAGA
jgi:hypothetical protein